jgi:hypothetical protein
MTSSLAHRTRQAVPYVLTAAEITIFLAPFVIPTLAPVHAVKVIRVARFARQALVVAAVLGVKR